MELCSDKPSAMLPWLEELVGHRSMRFILFVRYSSEGRPLDAELSKARLAACDATRRVLAIAPPNLLVFRSEAM